MSVTKLQTVRDQVVANEIGLHLDVVKTLIAAIDEHIQSAPDPTLQTKVTGLEEEVALLQGQVALLKAEHPEPETNSE
jgi:hypothetical protein